jgi:GTP:adenosylcobinamide-phosphate guanylyltransferase
MEINKMLNFPVVILAGGRNSPEMKAVSGVDNRALLKIDGETMISRIHHALINSGIISQVIVVGDIPPLPDSLSIPDRGSLVENIYAGLEKAGNSEKVLICTSDIPFLTEQAVADFVQKAQQIDADLVYPIVSVDECSKRFPGIKRTSIALKEGRFTGGNMMLIRPGFLLGHRKLISDCYAARKSPLKLAAMLGFGIITRLIISQLCCPDILKLESLQDAASHMIDGKIRACITPWAEIATDIDKPEDIIAIRK